MQCFTRMFFACTYSERARARTEYRETDGRNRSFLCVPNVIPWNFIDMPQLLRWLHQFLALYHHEHISMINPQTQIKYEIAAHFIMRFISSHNSYAKVMKTGKVEDDWLAIQPASQPANPFAQIKFCISAVWQEHSIDEHIRLIGHNPSWDFRWLFFSQMKHKSDFAKTTVSSRWAITKLLLALKFQLIKMRNRAALRKVCSYFCF